MSKQALQSVAAVALDPVPVPVPRRGPTLVTVIANGSVRVINETIAEDGRERFENGSTVLVAQEEGNFIVGASQSLRIIEEV